MAVTGIYCIHGSYFVGSLILHKLVDLNSMYTYLNITAVFKIVTSEVTFDSRDHYNQDV